MNVKPEERSMLQRYERLMVAAIVANGYAGNSVLNPQAPHIAANAVAVADSIIAIVDQRNPIP